MSLKIGDKLPDFSLSDQDGKTRTSKQCKGKKLILFFYPKDDTPGCTAEACGFRDKYDLFKLFGAVVWGVSNDNQLSHKKFAEKNKLPFPILCDENNVLRKMLGVPMVLSLLDGRVTYLVDSNGIIRYIFNDLLNSSKHVTIALEELEKIHSESNVHF